MSPDKPESIIPQSDLRITNVALADELKDENGRTTIKLNYHTPIAPEESDDEEGSPQAEPLSTTVLCSLIPSKVRHRLLRVPTRAGTECKSRRLNNPRWMLFSRPMKNICSRLSEKSTCISFNTTSSC